MDNVFQGLFSFRGRMGRAEFWLLSFALGFVVTLLLLAGMMIMATVLGAEAMSGVGPLYGVASLLLQLLTLWPALAVLVKRGHDRNYPAVMSIGLWVGAVAAFAAGAFVPFVSILGWLIWIYVLVDYGFLPGTPGRNRYDVAGPSRSVEREATAALFD